MVLKILQRAMLSISSRCFSHKVLFFPHVFSKCIKNQHIKKKKKSPLSCLTQVLLNSNEHWKTVQLELYKNISIELQPIKAKRRGRILLSYYGA